MTTERTRGRMTSDETAMGTAEKGLAWVFAAIAAVFGVIGLLRGFGIVGMEGVDPPAAAEALPIEQAAIQADFWSAMVWMFPAFAAGILAWTMSGSRHHARHMDHTVAHAATYVVGAIAIVLGALALLAGFNLLGQATNQVDGVLWGMAAVVAAFITGAVHASIPTVAEDEDYLVRLVETRVASRPAGTPPGETAPGTTTGGPTP